MEYQKANNTTLRIVTTQTKNEDISLAELKRRKAMYEEAVVLTQTLIDQATGLGIVEPEEP